MLHRTLFGLLLLLLAGPTFGQQFTVDELKEILANGKENTVSFDDHITIQREFANTEKGMTQAFGEALIARKEFMKVDSMKAKAYYELGYNYRNWGDNEKTKFFLTESLTIYKKLKDIPHQTDVTNLLAVYYANIDKDSTAIQLYTETIKLAQSIPDTLRWISPYKGLSSLFAKIGLNEKCIAYCKEGLQLARKINHPPSIAALSNNMAIGYYQKKEFGRCIELLKEALVVNEHAGMTEAIIRNLSNIGDVYKELRKLDSASIYVEKAVLLLPQIQVPRTSIYTFISLADLKILQTKYAEAIKFAQNAIELGKKSGLESISAGAYKNLYEAYKGLGQQSKALEAYENYWRIQEKFLETERSKAISSVEQEFQTFKKDTEIEILKKDKSLSQTQLNSAIGAAVLLGLLSLLFFSRFRLKKKSAEELSIKNAEIQEQSVVIQTALTEKETLLREIHHRVKNNLQIISSLLNIQSDGIDDPGVLSSIKEGQSRVQAMSLIHSNLYQSKHINNVDIENYLKELVAYLSQMFAGSNKDIEIEVSAKQIEFDIDTAIPLGLIVNELVSNAYKYAFDQQEKGQIKIGINSINDTDYELHVKDNGKGLGEGFDPKKSKSLGLKLVKILSKQLRGKFRSESNGGALFIVSFKDLRAYQSQQS
ncbi:Two-component sensor histidine kinase, contains HisKA and HATPase domains [Spirosomataceae bacterium TFI 002]|nr:Two-component sensor histidine kinase, contains HisKA and HATPase domains [Spirosomataceae bacterium TFI 002]